MSQNPSVSSLCSPMNKHKKMKCTLHDIPYDVVTDILTRLPAKSLTRFRCVCKTWCDFIVDSSFISMHIHQFNKFHNYSKQISKRNLIDRSRPPYNQMSLRDGDLLVEHEIWKLPFIVFHKHDIKIVGSCNGLICFKTSNFAHDLYLWNPSIRKLKVLPPPHIHPFYDFDAMRAEHGIGFDSRTNDFKVVRFLYLKDNYKHNFNVRCHEVEVYSLSTNSWKRITTIVPCYTTHYRPHAFVNGAIHWMVKKEGVTGDLIMSFDFANEVFREISPPNPYIREHDDNLYIAEFQKSLSLLSCDYDCIEWSLSTCCLWVMKEYGMTKSWTKQFTVRLQSRYPVERPLGFATNGEVLLLKTFGDELYSYDSESQQTNDVGIHASDAVTYVESLALLKEGRKQFVERQTEPLGEVG